MTDDKMPKTDSPLPRLRKDDENYWKTCLTPEQYEVLRKKGTEAAYTGKYNKNKETGMYVCGACGQELFSSETKFDSGTGWPSFTDHLNLGSTEKEGKNGIKKKKDSSPIELREDKSHGMVRTEVLCKKCGSHLGHVFPDGPKEIHGKPSSGQRYCINSLALGFKKK